MTERQSWDDDDEDYVKFDLIGAIREKAQLHKDRYSGFSVEGFMEWVERHDEAWQLWALNWPTVDLNKRRRFEAAAARLDD